MYQPTYSKKTTGSSTKQLDPYVFRSSFFLLRPKRKIQNLQQSRSKQPRKLTRSIFFLPNVNKEVSKQRQFPTSNQQQYTAVKWRNPRKSNCICPHQLVPVLQATSNRPCGYEMATRQAQEKLG
uniref:Uncharacterized protein n=1 Tax=Solanum tuberosum TaxID=4113 RepID=M1DHI2_SOLTU